MPSNEPLDRRSELQSVTADEEARGLGSLFELGVELPIPPHMTRKVAGYIGRLEAELAAMTEDRNLWRDAHDEDCPNLAMLETVQQERDLLKQQLAAAVGPDLSPALEAAEAVALADENERLRRVLIDIGHGVKLMVPEPQQSGLMRMIDAALAPVAHPSAEGTEAADGKA